MGPLPMSIERLLKTLHSWLGVVILPWVVAAGFTGLYMNHSGLVLGLMPAAAAFDAAAFAAGPEARAVDAAGAARVAQAVAPGVALLADGTDVVKGRDVFVFRAGDGKLTVDAGSGLAQWSGRYVTQSHAPDGRLLHRRVRWSTVLSSIHKRGWIGTGLGAWLADIVAGALMVFGLSGLVLFAAPRLRRLKNRRAKAAAMAAAARAR